MISIVYYVIYMTYRKPMLAGTIESNHDLERLHYPLLVSPKLDGIRATVQNGILLSRNLKPIRNEFVQRHFSRHPFEGLDGELISGDPTAKNCFRETTSAVMSFDGIPDQVKYHVFDMLRDGVFQQRFKKLTNMLDDRETIRVVPHTFVTSADGLLEIEKLWLKQGYEGVMVRDPNGPYKHGRSTFNEGWLLKLKRFKDSEATVLEVIEELHNDNISVVQPTGKSKRSHRQEHMIPKGTCGSLLVRDIYSGIEFNVGGFTDPEGQRVWNNKQNIIGKTIKYKYFPVGVKDKPRHPVFLGFRED